LEPHEIRDVVQTAYTVCAEENYEETRLIKNLSSGVNIRAVLTLYNASQRGNGKFHKLARSSAYVLVS
jgi:hypothetical protein